MAELADLKARILANPEARTEYEVQAPEFDLARELIAARTRAGLTQSELAERMHTTQSTIARLESGRTHAEHAHAGALCRGDRKPRRGATGARHLTEKNRRRPDAGMKRGARGATNTAPPLTMKQSTENHPMAIENLTTTICNDTRRAAKAALRSVGIQRFRVLWLRDGKERKSPWFYSKERADLARDAMADKYGRAIVYVD